MKPKDYVLFNQLQKCEVSNLTDEFEEELIQMSGKCMDVGCGPGDITKDILLRALNPNAVIIGTDISKDMIEYAKKNNSNERLKFEVLDIQTKNLPEKYISGFDHIFSFHALNWCYDIRQAFENIYHMIRPDGNILMNLVASHDIYNIINILARDIRFAPYIQDIRNYVSPFNDSCCPRKELRKILKSIGFEVFHCSLRETTYSSKDFNNFISSIISIYPFFDKMPRDVQEEFKNEYIRKFVERKCTYKTIQNNQKQTIMLDLYKLLIVYARKNV
ncbi:juvenile hormone acid O-methyltransferase-like isoform X1 [Cataglyphis hispanica]|uniref:juvenile hormone acid O-methyltransferase-like isoform X1 n=1 Tax=Cataglyphis hispanica TaxID=1086592 RepID=UPI00217FA2C6|nr:juvenile hormone acid O-methyltransferase-like isoform X1 [Cataglyphis hispanica]XP_050458201.1 juvenile hormone acid O-methyltransferase-like isoform X1 [Cataglyphis hispanica]